ncbi:glycogen synthase GlgA [Oscillibacter sp.]|jgi:starch synthase|uniref:glycogen synthase GlgA n=1 Tax=Oscillibacter sp. TaxID=1945593 RepID=UPI00261BA198|nr:glycogen synthase GlgA [Oscillibacter sp.]
MKILYATSEAVPFCKTGGLADVAGSLPAALAAEGAEVAVVVPLYRRVRERFGDQLTFLCYDYVNLAWRHVYCGLFALEKDGVIWYFLDNEQYFDRPDLYGYMDDGERFGFFSRAIVRMLDHMKFWPDVINCNDWQTALVPVYLKDDGVREERFRSVRTTLTVHNIEYQGRYNPYVLGDLFGLDAGWVEDGTLLMDGDLNLLKGAVLCADAVNAVSPTYANELKMAYFAHRMESVMRQCEYKLFGVLNGIDMDRYDPAKDPSIAAAFSTEDMSGKDADKAHLQRLVGLREEPHVPVVAIVSRLVSHKGLDLICEVLHDMMKLPMQLVVLGKGDKKYEEFFHWAAQQYPGRMAVRLDYNEELSMAIYAGADLFLMPSKSEPCGLSQMIAMRYGTVPIVRETGGLKDTVHPYEAWRDAGNGFTFANYASNDMLHVIREAVYLYKDFPDAFGRLRKRAMECDFSWARSAGEYLRIYAGVTGQVWPAPEAAPVEASPAAEPVSVEEAAAPAEEASAEEKAGPFEEPVPAAETVPETVAAEKASAGRSVEKAAPAGETADVKAEPKKRGRKPGTKNGAKKEPARKAAEKKAAGETKKKGTAAKK